MTTKAFIKEQNFAQRKKQEILDQMEWNGRKYNVTGADVNISKIKSNKSFAINIIFKNDIEQLVDPDNVERIQVCVLDNRLYFRTNEKGYKITKRGNSAYLKCGKFEQGVDFVGSYELEYDSVLKYFYIQKGAADER